MNNDTNFSLLLHLDYDNLLKMCSVNKDILNICNSDLFWNEKYEQDFKHLGNQRYTYLQENDFKTWRELYLWSYLLEIDYTELKRRSSINKEISIICQSERFWREKYEKDYLKLGSYVKTFQQAFNRSWQNIYKYAIDIDDNYPNVEYPFDDEDIDTLYEGQNLPTFKSSNPKDFVDEITNVIGADIHGVEIVKANGKIIPLINFYNTSFDDVFQDNIRTIFMDNPLLLIDNLEDGDTLVLYLFGVNSFTENITRRGNEYILFLMKSKDLPF
jgi:hypothetical protein